MGKKNKRKILKNVLPNVSIVTPTFNRVQFLKILHNCILNQNYPLNKLEWIIVDGQNNNSKLNEVPLLIDNLRKISNLKIIYFSLPMDENNKLGALRNKTNELASGNIIVCMDDDDYYPPNRVINAVKGLNFGQLDLAGISKLYIYDFYLDNVIEFGPLHKNHSTNNGLAYTKNYTKKFKYKNDDSISEEIYFLNNYKNKMVQLNSKDSLLHLSHKNNTANKRKLFESAFYNSFTNLTDKYRIFDRNKLNSLIPNNILNDYNNIIKNKEKKYSKYDIVYYCSLLCNKWNPKFKSLGGSEQAVVHLSNYWASKGLKVAVYLDIDNDLNYNNVDYLSCKKFDPELNYKNIILWRSFGFYTLIKFNLKVDNLYLDLHDTNPPKKLENYIHKIKKIFAKSNFHKYSILKLSNNNDNENFKNKILNLMNGIRIENFKKNTNNVKRNKFRFCYTSCYTRGLLPLLEYFYPVLKKIIPEVEFHIYYGYSKDEKYKNLNKKIKNLIDNLDDVYEHGRVSMEKIIEEKYKSNFHLYLTNSLAETDCIAIRESLVTNCIPIISNNNVFYERDGIKFDLNPNDPDCYSKIAIRISQLIKNTKYCDEIRNQLKFSYTIKSWDEIGLKWLKEFNLFNASMKKEKMKNIKKSYLINLERRPDKLKEFFNNYPYKKENITVFKAVDGNNLILTDDLKKYIINYANKNLRNNYGPIKGELGCTLSHLNIWKEISNDTNLKDNDKIVIFEDDAFFTENFTKIWEEIVLPDDLDFMYIGGRFYDKYIPGNINKWFNYSNNVYYTKSEDRTTHSYILTKKGANKLLNLFNQNKVIENPIDHWLMEKMIYLNSYTILPLLCWSPPDYKSDIKRDSNNYFDIKKLNEEIFI